MLTSDQLQAIGEHVTEAKRDAWNDFHSVALDLVQLLADYEQLTQHNKRMAQALAQLSDAENWSFNGAQTDHAGRIELPQEYYWMGNGSPLNLAEQALVNEFPISFVVNGEVQYFSYLAEDD